MKKWIASVAYMAIVLGLIGLHHTVMYHPDAVVELGVKVFGDKK